MSQEKPKKILVGMSGGVDSSVSAALLVEQGYQVEGVFMKVWSDDDANNELVDCPWETELKDAQAVADQLGIPLHIRNVQREYFDRVVSELKAGYAKGETPNPDILCNSEIKFGILYDWAMEQGFDAVATGHYAQIDNGELAISNDDWKDQTYFLWRVNKDRFKNILFPIGHLTKTQVRAEAKRLNLPNAEKPDSQGICFLGRVDVRTWLKRELATVPGSIVDESGAKIGTHPGAALFTIGQRHGVGNPGGTEPLFVSKRDLATNTITVAPRTSLARFEFEVRDLNWLVEKPFELDNITARIRHQGEKIPCQLMGDELHLSIQLDKPAFGVASGQSVVLYRDKQIIGGGIIQG